MPDGPRVLLTNDDGIDSPGLRAMAESLSEFGTVTVVAPATDQSAAGRSISHEATVHDHDLGYALSGTPADCVVGGLGALVPEPDVVVSGCNVGANLGEYALGRSGTVGAAVEAAFFGVPAIATSLYVPPERAPIAEFEPSTGAFAVATDVTRRLLAETVEAGVFDDDGTYLNVNVPYGEDAGRVELTRPSTRYEMDATREGDVVSLHDRIWESMDPETMPDPPGTDRRAVAEGRISLSPLVSPHATSTHERLEAFAAAYSASAVTDG